MKPHDEQLIWEAYIKEDDLSHGQYEGPQDLEPMARIEPQELGDEEEIESFQEGDLVHIDARVGGGKGQVIEMSPAGTHGIIELDEDMDSGLQQGDRVAVHISDLSHVNDEEEPVDVDDLNPEDDVPYESVRVTEGDPMHPTPHHPYDKGKASVPKGTSKSRMKEWKEKNPGKAYPGDEAAATELDEGCGVCSALHGHGDGHEAPKVKVAILKKKKKHGIPSKIMNVLKKVFGGVSEQNEDHSGDNTVNENSFDEAPGWTPEETIEWHSDDVIKAGAEWLDQELLHAKVNSLEDVHPDLLDDLAGMVIHDMQKAGKLPKRLDYDEYLDERDGFKAAIEKHLSDNFDHMVDVAEDKAVERGDRMPLDSGVEGDLPHAYGGNIPEDPGPYERHRLSINPGGVPPSP